MRSLPGGGYRLTAADYPIGNYCHYAYDAVGNRLSQESMVSGLSSVNSYQYDIANRLIDVDGVGYIWDANGNLLSDGVNTYAYDSANRLVEVSNQSTVSSYQYNGFGDRLTQNGAQYTLDLNSGLTQVLSDGATSYTYGLGRISQQAGSTAEYFLGDALGSVRQLTDVTGAVTFAQGYDPYGVVTLTKGAGQSAYGFTGEQQDANGLVYLRARYYVPRIGRFATRDPSGLESNLYIYASANPINQTDPIGLDSGLSGPANFLLCTGIHTGVQGNVPITAGQAVNICIKGFRKDLWASIPFWETDQHPTSAHNLFGQFLYETGNDNWLFFEGNEPLTQELAQGILVNNIRQAYYRDYYRAIDMSGRVGSIPFHAFGVAQYFASLINDSPYSIGKLSLPLEFVLGSFNYQVRTLFISGEIRVGFRVDNDMTIESGTHIRDRFPGEYEGSVEELINQRPDLATRPLSEVVNTIAPWGKRVISILSSKPRTKLNSLYGGGSLFQTFTWTERYDPCIRFYPQQMRPKLEDLDLQKWVGWQDATIWPDSPFPRRP